jgi:PAS domain S-box-containing protein
MGKKRQPSDDLRKKAEQVLEEQIRQGKRKDDTEADAVRLVHELQVHQIELEMQNEELRTAQAELEASQSRYEDLYELAPIGYCTIRKDNMILEANLTVSNMLGIPRKTLLKHPFTNYIHKEDQDIYYHHQVHLFDSGEPQTCDLRILKKDSNPFWVQLRGAIGQYFSSDEEKMHSEPVCFVVISDITARKEAIETLKNKIGELTAFQRFSVGRELKMIELKKEIDELLRQAGEPTRYNY